LTEAKVLAEEWRLAYNHERPHSALGYKTPAEFAAEWRSASVAFAPVGAPAFVHPHQGESEIILMTEGNPTSHPVLPERLVQKTGSRQRQAASPEPITVRSSANTWSASRLVSDSIRQYPRATASSSARRWSSRVSSWRTW